MNHRSNLQPCREILVKQLITLGEEKRTFLDAYFDVREPERIQMEKLLTAYTGYVQKLLLGPDELLHSVVLIGSEIRFDYIDFHTSDAFKIVMPEEADPDAGCISFLSPVGRQLLLSSKGETRSVTIPAGSMRVRITEITWSSTTLNPVSSGGVDHAL